MMTDAKLYWRLPASAWRLAIAYALMVSGTSLTVLIAGIIGLEFAPHPSLATLPVACAVIGVAASTLPTGRFLERWGRRRVFVAYGLIAMLAAACAAASLVISVFPLYCLTTFAVGWTIAAAHQYRFAALESVDAALAPRATSVLLMGGIFAAAIGPELAVAGRDLLETRYAGSYLLLVVCYAVGTGVVMMNPDVPVQDKAYDGAKRPLRDIVSAPVIKLAMISAAVGYAAMSFVMTASPISMHEHAGHDIQSIKWVIQSHIIAMYLPSLVFAWLFQRLGFRILLVLGVLALLLSIVVSMAGMTLGHYWVSMILLGIGWNFLFLTGTNLLPRGYRSSERFRVQSVNDFIVFAVQAMAALGAGWFLFRYSWSGLLGTVIPLLIVFSLFAWYWSGRVPKASGTTK